MDRVTVEQAAHILGIKEESVRKRVSRGKLRSGKDEDGRLLVYVDGTGTVSEGYGDRSVTDGDEQPDLARELIEEMRSRGRSGTWRRIDWVSLPSVGVPGRSGP